MDKAVEMQKINPTLIREMPEEERQAPCDCMHTPAEQQADSEEAKHNAPLQNLTIRDLKKTVDAHHRPAVYGTMQTKWKDAGRELLQNVTNA